MNEHQMDKTNSTDVTVDFNHKLSAEELEELERLAALIISFLKVHNNNCEKKRINF